MVNVWKGTFEGRLAVTVDEPVKPESEAVVGLMVAEGLLATCGATLTESVTVPVKPSRLVN
jgi:hypothetical protein